MRRIVFPLGLAVVCAAFLPAEAVAQADACTADSRGGTTNTVQPSIIVIPFTREGEDMRTVLESDPLRRVAATQIKEGFDNLGFQTVDLRGVIQAVDRAGALTMDAETDFKTAVIQESRADIYVEAEVLDPEMDGDLQSVSVIRTAYLTTNGLSLANNIGYSGRYRGVELSRLVERAAETDMDAFLATMQRAFDDILENGAVVGVEIAVAQGAAYDLDSEVGPDNDLLSFVIEDWFAENALFGDYSVSGVTSVRMVLDAVKVPLRDPETCRNYNPTQFAREFIRFLRTLDVRARPTISRGLIVIELQ